MSKISQISNSTGFLASNKKKTFCLFSKFIVIYFHFQLQQKYQTEGLLFKSKYIPQELGSISARVLINQSVRACDLGKLLRLGVSGTIYTITKYIFKNQLSECISTQCPILFKYLCLSLRPD